MNSTLKRDLTPIPGGYLFTLVHTGNGCYCLPSSTFGVACSQWLRHHATFNPNPEVVIRLTERPHKDSFPFEVRKHGHYERRSSPRSAWTSMFAGASHILNLFTINNAPDYTTLHISVSPP